MEKTKNNKMLMHGFILVTILATAKSAEAEITMEAAFQGHCGHTSPCEQLCYEIHDGMYECDCIEGYELNKNGYSCQVINSTSSSDGHTKSDEDVLYQKGASFSAKLADSDNERDNQLNAVYAAGSSPSMLYSASAGAASAAATAYSASESSETSLSSAAASGEENTDDSFFGDDLDQLSQLDKVNSNDYYISSESINFNNPDQELLSDSPDVPEFKAKALVTSTSSLTAAAAAAAKAASHIVVTTTAKPINLVMRLNAKTAAKLTTATTTISAANAITMAEQRNSYENDDTLDDYYSNKPDMSIYDDVNNNQLNLRPLSSNTYHNQNAYNSVSQQMSISNDNQIRNHEIIASTASATTTTTRTAVPAIAAAAMSSTNNSITALKISNNSNISYTISTATGTISEKCNLDCGSEGLCDNTEGYSRCLCPFGKTSNACMEDIKVRVPKFSKKSWLAFPALRGAYKHVQIRVEFRPESFDGIVLLSGERDDLTGDFMALLLNKGFVEFWFDCGSGVGSVRSRETILLNEWNSVIIYRHRWDAWLVLNHGTKVQGRSNGLFSRITFREPVFLGGTGNITGLAKRLPVYSGFVGCVRRFVANEHEYKFEEHPLGDVTKGFDIQDCITDKCFKYPCQHGGKCLPSDQGAVCLCPIGFVGDLCEIRLDLQVPAFNGSSFLRYAPLGDSALIWLEIKVILKPEHPDGLILYSGPEKHGDFVALSLYNGFVEFIFDLGSGPAVVRSEYPLSIGQWHTIKMSRTARLAVLKIDQSPEVMTVSSNGFWHLSLPNNLFLGGVNHMDKLPLDLKYKPFFVGCIQKIDINGHALAIISEALGGTNIGNCPHACVARPCGSFAECVPQMESYECRCSAYNMQCNKAAEVPLEELQMNRAKSKSNSNIKSTNQTNEAKHRRMIMMSMNGHEGKAKKQLQTHKQMHKLHGKDYVKCWHKIPQPIIQTPMTTTTAASLTTNTATTNKAAANVHAVEGKDGSIENDDIIFSDVHGMHRKYEHNAHHQVQRNNNNNNANTQRTSQNNKHLNHKHQGKSHHHPHHQERQYHQSHKYGYGSKSHPAYYKHATVEHKLSRMPTHYESFQTNPESDILTFDDNIELVETTQNDYYYNQDVDKGENGDENNADDDGAASHDVFIENDAYDNDGDSSNNNSHNNENNNSNNNKKNDDIVTETDSESEPFIIDESFFDASDGTPDYQRKELAQDMKRIMMNTHDDHKTVTYNAKQAKSALVTEYDYVDMQNTNNNNAAQISNNNVKFDKNSESNTKLNNYKYTKSENGDEDNAQDDDTNGYDDILEPVEQFKTLQMEQQTVEPTKLATTKKLQASTTPQTHTDWSLLKKFELSADHQSQIGVHKNFGACFAGEDSYFHYNDAETMSQIISYNIDLNLRIKTHSQNGVILWTGRQSTNDENDDFLSLGIEDGYLHFRYDLGSGEIDVRFNATKVSDGLWHRVRAIRDSQQGYLEVDSRKSSTLHSPGKLRQLNTDTGLYVGGMPDVNYFTRRKYGAGIVGCISEIVLAGELKLNFDPNTLGTAHNVETGIL